MRNVVVHGLSGLSVCAGVWVVLTVAPAWAAGGPVADVTRAQGRGAEQFLAVVAGGSPQAIALAYHPAELDGLRTRLLERLRADAARNDSTSRVRLFGAGRQFAEIERLTSASFYSELAPRLEQRGRVFQDIKWLASVPEGESVHVIGRGKPPKDQGQVQVLTTVTLLPYGKEWRAAIPSEILAQIDDLLEGRTGARVAAPPRAATAAASAAPAAIDPAVGELLAAAEKVLIEGKCADYYEQHMSPNFRRATSGAAMKTLIATCDRSVSTRETLIAALRIVRGLSPRLEFEGARAVYDVSNQGLPFDRYVLERINKRWYIAE
jgi:hypothetical protein